MSRKQSAYNYFRPGTIFLAAVFILLLGCLIPAPRTSALAADINLPADAAANVFDATGLNGAAWPLTTVYVPVADGKPVASGNTVNVGGSVGVNPVMGGATFAGGTVRGNTVNITDTGGAVPQASIAGGYSSLEGTVAGNTVRVTGGKFDDVAAKLSIYGGYAFDKNGFGLGGQNMLNVARGNRLIIDANGVDFKLTASGNLYGGRSINGLVENNELIILNGTFTDVGFFGGASDSGHAAGNKVVISGGTIDIDAAVVGREILGGTVWGYSSSSVDMEGDARNNSVTINGTASVNNIANIYGGHVIGKGAGTGNNVLINVDPGKTVSVRSSIAGAFRSGDSGEISRNAVEIRSGIIKAVNVAGGLSAAAANLSDNTVIISGGDLAGVTGGVYGSLVHTTTTGSATRSTVVLAGSPVLGGTLNLFGGLVSGGAGDSFTGNSLKIDGFVQNGIPALAGNFETIDFVVGRSTTTSGPIFSVGTIENTDHANKTRIGTVQFAADGFTPAPGTAYNLLHAAAPIDFDASPVSEAYQGFTLWYGVESAFSGGDYKMTVMTGPMARPETKALAEGFLGGAVSINRGADLIASKGLAAATDAASRGGIQGFLAFGADSSKYKTGSKIDSDNYGLILGLAHEMETAAGGLTLGAFLEYGKGDFDTWNSLPRRSVRGSGDTEHFGGGLLARLSLRETSRGQFYAEASARAGSAETKFDSADVNHALGNLHYKAKANYMGAHLGTGYVFKLSEAARADLYVKYLYSHMGGDTVRLVGSETVSFSSVDSHRVRAGGRVTFKAGRHVEPYAGAAWEHEFAGKAKSSINGRVPVDAPELKGDTGIGEIGLRFGPDAPVHFDIGLQGYVGQRKGYGGTMQLTFDF
ncbi:MAG: autotransporter outer membrane beta-barrel domain-containing protein [Deltaproteobacteria bacterium]|jgi:hypothetical protein|nr:autotransporter outer membrane beta-barrel domain-containing protein [Deltaproteobacteria bacterium]